MSRPKLTVVVSLFNEEASLPELVRRLEQTLEGVGSLQGNWEVVFVDDGSADNSLAILRTAASRDVRHKVISFSRNFGHQSAITAGLDRANGDYVVLMDADLQDPPEVIPEMLRVAEAGFDVVYGRRRRRRGESLFKRATAAVFYRSMRLITQTEIPIDAGDFRLLARSVVMTLRALKERHRFVRGLVAWVGFRQTHVEYDRDARFAGTTKYPLRRMIRFAIDGATSFSTVPLRIATWLGLLTGFIAVLGGLTSTAFRLFIPEIVLPGWTALMVAIAFGFSVQLLITGILGEYVGRIYEEVKRRPLYVTEEEINLGPPDQDGAQSVIPRSVSERRTPDKPIL